MSTNDDDFFEEEKRQDDMYDFSESGSHDGLDGPEDGDLDAVIANLSKGDKNNYYENIDDEQHTQKINSQVDALNLRIEDLMMELDAEKNLHEATRARLEGKTNSEERAKAALSNANSALGAAQSRSLASEEALILIQRELSNCKKELAQARDAAAFAQQKADEAMQLVESTQEIRDKTRESQNSAKQSKPSTANSKNSPNIESTNSVQSIYVDRIKELEQSLAEYQQLVDNFQAKENDKALFSENLKNEITKFCINNTINVDEVPPPSQNISESYILLVFQETSKKIKELQKKSKSNGEGRPNSAYVPPTTTTTMTGSDSELQQRIINLEEELRLALAAAEDIRALKAKVLQLVEHIRCEKESRLKAEAEVKLYVKKMTILSSHIEKLMAHLKHEATAKIKYMDQLKVVEQEVQRIKTNTVLITKKSLAKDRLIAELREGSKVLEDQLRLMDEKYLELRTKLDWAREQSSRKIKKAEKTATDLRVKFVLAGNTNLLDNVPLPAIASGSGGSDSVNSTGQSVTWAQSPRVSHHSDSSSFKKKSKGGLGGVGGGSLSGGGGKSMSSLRSTTSSTLSEDPEASLNNVLEKIRRHKHESTGWNEDKLKQLTKARHVS